MLWAFTGAGVKRRSGIGDRISTRPRFRHRILFGFGAAHRKVSCRNEYELAGYVGFVGAELESFCKDLIAIDLDRVRLSATGKRFFTKERERVDRTVLRLPRRFDDSHTAVRNQNVFQRSFVEIERNVTVRVDSFDRKLLASDRMHHDVHPGGLSRPK